MQRKDGKFPIVLQIMHSVFNNREFIKGVPGETFKKMFQPLIIVISI